MIFGKLVLTEENRFLLNVIVKTQIITNFYTSGFS